MKRATLVLIVCKFSLFAQLCYPQDSAFNRLDASNDAIKITHESKSNRARPWVVAGTHALVWTGSYLALNEAWFEGYERVPLHFVNDWPQWNQLDKMGHAWTAYELSRFSTSLWSWAGMKDRGSIWMGSACAMAYQTMIEIQDGLSSHWGFSWGDMLMNLTGSGGFAAQQLLWKEQRIQIKFSYLRHSYPDEFVTRRNELFGESEWERVLEDYNGHTYWLSVNPRSFLKAGKFPKWLNLAVGYSSDLMLAGAENKWVNGSGDITDRTDVHRTRRFYISPDIDLTRINVRSRFLRGVLFVINMMKFPAPALELNTEGKLRLHGLYF